MRHIALSTVLLLAGTSFLQAQSPAPTKAKHTQPADDSIRKEMESLQQQMEALKAKLAERDAQADAAAKAAADAQAQAAAAADAAKQASSSSAATATKVDALSSTVTDMKTSQDTLTETVVVNQANVNAAIDSPMTIHYKGIEITPYGFLAAESVNRSKSINSDINTPFNSTPYPNSGQAYTSEYNPSGRQSRLGLIVNSITPFGRMGGFYEADFLGVGVTSNDNQSNSYVLRQRQAWAQVALNNGFTFTGGQMWSLVTEVKKGISSAPGIENLPQTIDAQYHVGFSWTRQYGARFAKSFNNNKEFVAIGIEEPQIVGYTSSTTPPDFFVGSVGTNGGLYNLTNKYSNNLAPDIIVKFAADTSHGHFEVGALARFFRSRIYPNIATPSAAGAYNNTVAGGGYFANARFDATKKINLGIHIMGGDGVNRYGTSQLADVTVHTDGSLEPLRGLQGLFSIETHPTKKLDIFGYAGSEYAQRTYYTGTVAGIAGTSIVGYAPPSISVSGCFTETVPAVPGTGTPGGVFGGAPYDPSSSCPAQTRVITEGTAGFTYRFFNTPTKGRIQFSLTYSYLTKTAWVGLFSGTYGTPGAVYAAPTANNHMIFTGFRYYLP